MSRKQKLEISSASRVSFVKISRESTDSIDPELKAILDNSGNNIMKYIEIDSTEDKATTSLSKTVAAVQQQDSPVAKYLRCLMPPATCSVDIASPESPALCNRSPGEVEIYSRSRLQATTSAAGGRKLRKRHKVLTKDKAIEDVKKICTALVKTKNLEPIRIRRLFEDDSSD